MNIFLKILIGLLIVIVIILVLLLILIVLKCKYVVNIAYEKKKLSFDFKALFFTFYFLMDLSKKSKPEFKVMIFNISISDSSKRKKEDDILNGKSIAKSRFIKNKELEKEINVDEKIFAKLFARSKEYMKEIRDNVKMRGDKNKLKETKLEKKMAKVLPKDILYVAKLTMMELKKYCMDLSPKKLCVDANFGFSEPHYTGLLLALLAPLYSRYGDNIKVKADFALKGLNAKIYMDGMLQIIRLIIPAIHLLLDKQFRKVVFKKGSNK